MELYSPTAHEPLGAPAWTDAAAREAIGVIAADAEAAFVGDALWPNTAEDLEGDPDVPLRNVYLGAAGVLYALDELARGGLVELRRDWAPVAAGLLEGYRASPDWPQHAPEPVPSLLAGEAGILLVADRVAPSAAGRDALLAAVQANVRHPSNEPMWGAPGTMIAASAMLRRGDDRFAGPWAESAAWLLEQWVDDLWEQLLYGRRQRYVGPGHGFAGNVFALLQEPGLLPAGQAAAVEARAVDVATRLAQVQDGLCQWPPLDVPVGAGQRIRTQWCHGAPGMVISLAGLAPGDAAFTRLLEAGGELTWQAGPLATGLGLCHGTAGNGYAFLALFRRTQDERWLARARAFALHAAGQVERSRAERGRGRYSLFTGDVGVALALQACLEADARFPVFERTD